MSQPIGSPSSFPQKWSSNPARMICFPVRQVFRADEATTVFTSKGENARATP